MEPANPATTISHTVSPSNSDSGHTQRVNQSFSASSPPLPPATVAATRSAPSPPPLFSYQSQPTTLSPPLGQFFINAFLQAFGVAAAIAFGVFAVESVRQAEVANGYAAKALEQARVANEVAMLAICMSGNQTKGALDDRLALLCAHVSAAGGGVVYPAAATAVFTGAVVSSTSPTTTTTAATTTTVASGPVASTTLGDGGVTGAVPTATSGSSASPGSSPSKTNVIIGAVCGTVGGVLIVGLIILCLVKRSNRRARTTPASNADIKPTRGRRQHGFPSLDRPHKARKSRISSGENDSLGKERQGAVSKLWRWYRATFLDSTVHSGIG